ncbi:hypothetical protein LSAT2_031135 [Lamellibrachia satsuma]|nr:hypothetical protein LSAT2_031135 [Lamellibrachia satsuma]
MFRILFQGRSFNMCINKDNRKCGGFFTTQPSQRACVVSMTSFCSTQYELNGSTCFKIFVFYTMENDCYCCGTRSPRDFLPHTSRCVAPRGGARRGQHI